MQLLEKMTRKILYLIMHSRPYVNAYIMGERKCEEVDIIIVTRLVIKRISSYHMSTVRTSTLFHVVLSIT